ncbi:DNA (cytosine-5)-methyltransferase DRM2-like isoform X1 [Coffea arabica]|uniref:DNA (cytosine-5-)-methyltransferase n=2 Tax=Coffea arabica TaxID=13443 RepID=A0ABM4W2P0_COFAR
MDSSSIESNSIEWNTEDELDVDNISSSSSHQDQIADFAPSSSSCNCRGSNTIHQFLQMGFSKEMVIKAVKENGQNEGAVLDALLTYKTFEESPEDEQVLVDPCHAELASNVLDVYPDEEICENEEFKNLSTEKDRTVSLLVEMGYQAEEALAAIDRCSLDTPIAELVEFISAAQFAYHTDAQLGELSYDNKIHQHQKVCVLFLSELTCSSDLRFLNQLYTMFLVGFPKLNGPVYMSKKKRKYYDNEMQKLQKQRKYLEKQPMDHDNEIVHLPNPMVGFGVPNQPSPVLFQRRIPDEAEGRPYFYFENVALAPKGVWHTMSRFLYYIDPEFVDSKFFCAAARKRGYIHNLPIENRSQLLPTPPSTIHEALPHTKQYWPSWDKRMQLNCILTCIGSAKLTDRIKKAVEKSGDDEPLPGVKKYVIQQCKKWNLIWVGKNKVAPLEPHEMEMLMGFPPNHTRGGGISRTEQYTVLGNAFQVDTVAYHLSVLKSMFPDGISVLSLFSGIGGAEVALHRLGIPLRNVVSVEISETCRKILKSWWDETNQQGKLIHFHDIRMLTAHELEKCMSTFGGFDLIIGGSPCNNLAGGNRSTRNGLEGSKSCLFFEYYRIIELVRSMMRHR